MTLHISTRKIKMIKLKNLIKDVTEKHNCDCGGSCCTVTEGPDEIRKSKKELQKLVKAESKLRDKMMKLEQVFLQDPTKGNDKLAKELNQSYKKHVTWWSFN